MVSWLSSLYLKPKKLNILILSSCSLRSDRIGTYKGRLLTPNISKLAANSFVFDNAFTDMSWSNVSGFLSRLTIADLKKFGYSAIGEPWIEDDSIWYNFAAETPAFYYETPSIYRFDQKTKSNYLKNPSAIQNLVPADSKRLLQFDEPDGADRFRWSLMKLFSDKSDYSQDLSKIKNSILNKSQWPFLLVVHSKIMHFPYGGGFPDSPSIKYLLSEESKLYIKEYEKNVKKYSERLPFGLYFHQGRKSIDSVISTLNLEKQLADKIINLKTNPTFLGILNNKAILDKWQKSKYFDRDLEIIKETYDKRLMLYDASLKEILELYGNSDLLENTVVIFMGDHGESFLEHGYLTHGETVYDEMIRFPLFIKFPGQKVGEKINYQFYQKSIYDVVKKIMSGEINPDNFKKYIENEVQSEFIYSRNCSNNMVSLRYRNEWKLIQDFRVDKKYLYNLSSDPKELVDVYERFPDIANFLVEKSIEVLAAQQKNKMVYPCADFNN